METPKETLKMLPHAPGVYLYRDANGHIIYIGKAKDLHKRVSQYWERDAIGPKTKLLVAQIASIETIRTASELDALILEANLVHKHQPKYNVVLKDDKSPLYVLLTLSEPLPHILLKRRSDLPKTMKRKDALFGPYQSASVVRSLLRQLRHSIPFCEQKRRTGKPCFYTHIGLCNPCPSAIVGLGDDAKKRMLTHAYRTNINRLKDILSGKSQSVLVELEKEMQRLAFDKRFEEAAAIRDHVENLRRMLAKKYDPMLYMTMPGAVESIYSEELAALQSILSHYIPTIEHLRRIECMDISNTQGTYATGSTVVLTDGQKDTSEYKRFRIKTKDAPNDFAMMAEMVKRRFAHPEWPMPHLLLIDGGKGQVSAARSAIPEAMVGLFPVIGLAKRNEEIIIPVENSWKILRIPYTSAALHVLTRIRDEAHRFAITYHRLLRKNAFV